MCPSKLFRIGRILVLGTRRKSSAEHALQMSLLLAGPRAPSRDLVYHAELEILMLQGKPLGASYVTQVFRRFPLIARPANRGQTLWVVRIVSSVSQGEGRSMVEDQRANDQSRPTICTTPVLPKDDLCPDPTRYPQPFTRIKGRV